MGIFVKVGDKKYPASITGRIHDSEWDERSTKEITIETTYEDALTTFVDNVTWSILQEVEQFVEKRDENGEPIVSEEGEPIMTTEIVLEEFDNSDYNIAGDITDHRDGRITIKMGKLTELEEAYELMFGGM